MSLKAKTPGRYAYLPGIVFISKKKKKKSSVKLLNLAKQMKKYLKDAATYILEGYLV